ncbi:MAG: hypothetical protein M3Y93_04180 [Pseudomonadota bacterium]|nr:hypothetical protein [Pseudomonadota bacterium]
MASAAAAQVAPPASDKGDSWAKPAPASSSVTYRNQVLPKANSSSSPFKFKNQSGHRPVDQLSPGAMDKASVMGTDRPWQNGKPPVDCAMTPHSAGCG